MEHLLFAAYLILFAWLITKAGFFKKSGLSSSQLIILFLLKVIAGILYGWIGVYYGDLAQMVDTWFFHYESIHEYHTLMTHPSDFFTDIFHNTYQGGYTNFLTTNNSWWNDLKGNFLIKVLAIFNVFSFGNYYTNVVFYSFISLFGPVALYRVMLDHFPQKRIPVLIFTFLIPSFIYWTSGLHKEGIIFLGLSLITFHVYFAIKRKKISIGNILLILTGLILILGLRNYLIVALVPCLIGWILSVKMRLKPFVVFSCFFGLCILLFFTAKYIHPKLDLPHAVVLKQEEFMELKGGSSVMVEKLRPTPLSFLVNAPQAFAISTLRPYPSDVQHLLSLAAAIEIFFLLLMALIFLFWHTHDNKVTPFLLFCLFFSFSVLMMIGYSVNVLGAIVRYRSIILPYLIVPVAAGIDWKKISQFLLGNIQNNNNVNI